jgi:putative aldouronate transport system permease protein
MLIMKIGSLLSVGYEKLYLFCKEPKASYPNYQVATVVSTLSNYWGNEFGTAAEMINNLIGMILVIGANKIARKASDVSLY